jgi:hypothetical protein
MKDSITTLSKKFEYLVHQTEQSGTMFALIATPTALTVQMKLKKCKNIIQRAIGPSRLLPCELLPGYT